MDTLGKLVQIVTGISEQGYHLLQFRQFQLDHISINCHLPNESRKIGCPELAHFLLNHPHFIGRESHAFYDLSVYHLSPLLRD